MTGIINPKGKFVREGKRVRHDHYGMGSYVIAFEEEAGSVKDVEITEVDIDNFIRAKGAIFSSIPSRLTGGLYRYRGSWHLCQLPVMEFP